MKFSAYQKMFLALAVFSLFSSQGVWAASRSDIKETIQKGAETLKQGVDKCGDKIEDVREYVRNYNYKDLVHEHATSGPATITHVELNDHPYAVVVKPGERIEGKFTHFLDKNQCKDIKYHRLLLGFKDVGPQTAVGLGFGYTADKENEERFVLIAPQEPGIYQLRFRSVESYTEAEALKHWKDSKGEEPHTKQTIGIVVVKGS